MNIIAFVGKVEYIQIISEGNSKMAQVIFVEKYNESLNYIPCLIPHRILDDFEDHIGLGTILEIVAHLDSKIIIKDGNQTISQKIIVDKMSYFEINEDIISANVIEIGENFFNNKSIGDVPF